MIDCRNTQLDDIAQNDAMQQQDVRPARRRLDVSVPSTPASPTTRSAAAGIGSDKGSPGRLSRIAQHALAKGSLRDSASEPSSKVVKEIYRDGRGRRIQRPKTVRADVHMIGEIVGASGFPASHRALFCRYRLVYDGTKSWAVVRGLESGCTQVSSISSATHDIEADNILVWEQPIDVQFTTQKLEAWPSLLLMVFARDDAALRDTFVSYALCKLPITPGSHHITVRTWYPVEAGTQPTGRHIMAMHLGMAARLEDDLIDLGFVTDPVTREEEGMAVTSMGSGCIHLRLQLLCRQVAPLARQAVDHLYASLDNFQHNLEEERKKEADRKAALEEYQAIHHQPEMSEGLRQIREGRAARFEAAQRVLGSKHTPLSSREGSMFEPTRSSWSVERRLTAGVSSAAHDSSHRTGVQSAPRLRSELSAGGNRTEPPSPNPRDSPLYRPRRRLSQGMAQTADVRRSPQLNEGAGNVDMAGLLEARHAEREDRRKFAIDAQARGR